MVFYENYEQIAGRNTIWVQEMSMTLVHIFEQVGLYKNLENTKSMTCNTEFIWFKWETRPTSGGKRGRAPTFGNRSRHR